jgi:hypothetical protein
MSNDAETFSAGRCDGCGSETGPLMKLSMGRDFFGRSYDRLSPSSDQSPKWYCEMCSMHKNLQRDFRDIKAEYDKLAGGQASELNGRDPLQRAQLRLREIATILEGQSGSRLLNPADVNSLLGRIHAQPAASAG